MIPPKSKKELLKDLKDVQENTKIMDQYNQSQDLDGGMSSWTYNMGELNTGTAITTASTGELDSGLDVKFDVSDDPFQSSFDFDYDLRKKYPALKDAYDHYQTVKQMCETREKEEDAS